MTEFLIDTNFTCLVCGKRYAHEDIAGQKLAWGLDPTLTRFVLAGCPVCKPIAETEPARVGYRPISQQPAIAATLSGALAVDIDGSTRWGSFSGKIVTTNDMEKDPEDLLWENVP